jgi:hypothetical protein
MSVQMPQRQGLLTPHTSAAELPFVPAKDAERLPRFSASPSETAERIVLAI